MDGRICIRCGEYKMWEHFPHHKSFTSGYSSACKDCIAKRRLESVELFKQSNSALSASMDEVSKKGAEEILTNMGFELYNPENPVYLQFEERLKEKYGITFKQKKTPL